MNNTTKETLLRKKCVPCEGGVPRIGADQASQLLEATPKWALSEDANWIARDVVCKHFAEALDLLNRIGALAEAEQHHPDLHLTGYRKLRVELTTHAIGGLSENDLILAAKIDQILD